MEPNAGGASLILRDAAKLTQVTLKILKVLPIVGKLADHEREFGGRVLLRKPSLRQFAFQVFYMLLGRRYAGAYVQK